LERKLVTPARWDSFLGGNRKALTEAEEQGFNTFVAAGCAACHNGAYVGGGSFQKLELIKPWTRDDDPGRHSGRVHCAAKPAAGHGGYAQTGPELRGGGSRHPKAGQTRHSR
jgi:cytochrome c peroxidase